MELRSHWLFSVVTSLTGEQGKGQRGRGRGFDSFSDIDSDKRPGRVLGQQIHTRVTTTAHLRTARTAGELDLFAAHTDAFNNGLTTEYDEQQKQKPKRHTDYKRLN